MKTWVASFALLGLTTGWAQAATDWNAAATAWRTQYRDLALAEAARDACALEVSKPVRRAMKEAREGLRDALVQFGPVEKPREIVKAAGGMDGFCANATLMAEAKATVAAFAAQRQEDGATPKSAQAPAAMVSSTLSANAPTPVIDPNISLIRNCRKAVIAKLGKKAEKNDAFWPTYESCMKDQGAGWF